LPAFAAQHVRIITTCKHVRRATLAHFRALKEIIPSDFFLFLMMYCRHDTYSRSHQINSWLSGADDTVWQKENMLSVHLPL
jgi:hypothetical protein